MNLVCVFLAALMFQEAWHGSVGQTVDDLQIALSKLVDAIVAAAGNCSNSNDTSQVYFCLFTRENRDNPTIVTSVDQISNISKPVKLLVHGWGGNCDVDYIHVIKEAYLNCGDFIVLSLDYSHLENDTYQTAYCHAPAIGRKLGQSICNMSTIFNISMSFMHVVGHSLGAQIAGMAGAEAKKTCGSIGRITGLDPAGPVYQVVDTSGKLDKSDATLVDAIQTNQVLFGYTGSCGDVDYYPNCGYVQPGCEQIITNVTITDDILLAYIRCNHQRSCYLFAESITHNSFPATNCIGCGTPVCNKNLLQPTKTYMGEGCNWKSGEPTEYTLSTRATSPYGSGPEGPSNCHN